VPVVLMEAMAARVPVVSSRVAGIPELVEDGVSGLLVAPGDVDALARAMADLLRDPARRVRMGDAGRLKVMAEFNLQQEAGWLAGLLEAYITNAPRPGKRPVTERVVSEKGAA
jgi:glycosyltransferase involved in cell wall biosynthesis